MSTFDWWWATPPKPRWLPASPTFTGAFTGVPVGVTLRDYFMAHAPVEPQKWFLPAMPECPAVPSEKSIDDAALAQAIHDYDYIELPASMAERAAQWFTARNAAIEAQAEWQVEFRKQLYVQWPRAWADLMLAERERP
jgi:hypothetical protein